MEQTNLNGGRGGDLGANAATNPGQTGADENVGETLRKARKLFSLLSSRLEDEIDRLQFEADGTKEDEDRLKAVMKLMSSCADAMQTVLKIEEKLAGKTPAGIAQDVVINLDEARAEIESRLARLAA